MGHGPCKFTQRDYTCVLKGAKAAGVPVKIEIEDGKMTVFVFRDGNSTAESEKNKNEWDEIFDGKDQAKIRE